MIRCQRRTWSTGAASGIALLCLLWAGPAACASAPIQMLKKMPTSGTVRQGDIVYVDDGRCPAGEVKKIIGGDQKTGKPRQVECVKRPDEAAQP